MRPRCGFRRFGSVFSGEVSAVDLSAERVARNDAVFREANEAIAETAAEHGLTERVPLICECAEPTCTEIVRLSVAEYEMVRAEPRWFLNAPGHEVAAGPHGKVIERRDGYVVVEKIGEAGAIAEALDPRDAAVGDTSK